MLKPGESSAKNCEHELREGGVDGSEPADEVQIETPMQPYPFVLVPVPPLTRQLAPTLVFSDY